MDKKKNILKIIVGLFILFILGYLIYSCSVLVEW